VEQTDKKSQKWNGDKSQKKSTKTDEPTEEVKNGE